MIYIKDLRYVSRSGWFIQKFLSRFSIYGFQDYFFFINLPSKTVNLFICSIQPILLTYLIGCTCFSSEDASTNIYRSIAAELSAERNYNI